MALDRVIGSAQGKSKCAQVLERDMDTDMRTKMVSLLRVKVSLPRY